ncbi:MAG: HNH endonuclease signature motif containing protein [Oligoflexia bacterium]|nr:HNH endonuclease signature motif containing protein [Oligoflexia bacterium]
MNENIKVLDDQSLISSTRELVKQELKITAEILHYLREIERRKLFADLGYGSLFEFCVRELKYSESAAQRRISSMRLLKELPALEAKIETGALSLTVVSQAQTFFRNEEKAGNRLNPEQKKEVLLELEGASSREAEKVLLTKSSKPEAHITEQVRAITATVSEVKLALSEETLKDLEQLKGLLAHQHPHLSLSELVSILAKKMLNQLDPGKKEVQTRKAANPLPAPAVRKRQSIPAAVQRAVWKRDGSRCTHVHLGRRCESTYQLQIDHILEVARGGGNEIENLRLVCRQHNIRSAMDTFGIDEMERYLA